MEMEGWSLHCFRMILVCRKSLCCSWDFIKTKYYGFELTPGLLQRIGVAVFTFMFATGGVMVGGIAGAVKGQTTETGFCRGAAIGGISGAIVALELFESIIHGHFLSKVALFGSILNGKAFREWVSPAVLKAYQWQTGIQDVNRYEAPTGIFDVGVTTRGMHVNLINKLPLLEFHSGIGGGIQIQRDAVSCAICLQDHQEGAKVRVLPRCHHLFHWCCIDEWLARSATCPVCRNQLD